MIIFELTEPDGERVDSKVIDMLSDLNEKPRVSTSKIGVKTTSLMILLVDLRKSSQQFR